MGLVDQKNIYDTPADIVRAFNMGRDQLNLDFLEARKNRLWTPVSQQIREDFMNTQFSVRRATGEDKLPDSIKKTPYFLLKHTFSQNGRTYYFNEGVRVDTVIAALQRKSSSKEILLPDDIANMRKRLILSAAGDILERNSQPHWMTTREPLDPAREARIEFEVYLMYGMGTGKPESDWRNAVEALSRQRVLTIPDGQPQGIWKSILGYFKWLPDRLVI